VASRNGEGLDSILRYSAIVLAGFVLASVFLEAVGPIPGEFVYPLRDLASISGYVALLMTAASAVMMLFRKRLLERTRYPEGLRLVHVIVAAIGGVFLAIHVAFLLFYPISLTVFFGYLGSGAALLAWITGMVFLAGRRRSLFYHTVLSVGGIVLMTIHAFGLRVAAPSPTVGLALVIIACVVLVIGLRPLYDSYQLRSARLEQEND
jgi:drug/metabolite transporter (DMT)-like permease